MSNNSSSFVSYICLRIDNLRIVDFFDFGVDNAILNIVLTLEFEVKPIVHPETNVTVYDLVSTQLYLNHPRVFDVLENILITAIIPLSNFTVVVVATSATVVQLKRVIVWRQRASTNFDGREVWCYRLSSLLLQVVVMEI